MQIIASVGFHKHRLRQTRCLKPPFQLNLNKKQSLGCKPLLNDNNIKHLTPHSLSGVATMLSVQNPSTKRNLILQSCAAKMQRQSSWSCTGSSADPSPTGNPRHCSPRQPGRSSSERPLRVGRDGGDQAGAQCPWMLEPRPQHILARWLVSSFHTSQHLSNTGLGEL